ncbi:MAG: hypothetical protein ACUVRQ_08340 [Thermoanaerobaculaceae bacterium]
MKRLVALLPCLLLAALVSAGDPVALDRDGILWRVSATPAGTLLVGTRDGAEVARSLVPFPLGIAGQVDRNFQLVADETTGKVVVVWQRQWGEPFSDVVLAVWNGNGWERVSYLGEEPSLAARNPVLKLAVASSSYPDPEDPQKSITVKETFALVLWWQGIGDAGQAKLAVLSLAGSPEEEGALRVFDVSSDVGTGDRCAQPLPTELFEHPTFASAPPGPVAHLLVANPSTCLLFVHQVGFQLEPPSQGEGGFNVVGLRRRHTPIFGVRRVLPPTRELAAEGTRAVLGADLQPVLYRVTAEGVEYTVTTASGWSVPRLLKLEEGLSLEQAVALVTGLAR